MSDLDRLREIGVVVRPPAFEELVETRRRRTRRARLVIASTLAVAAIAAAGALVATGQILRTGPPPIAPSPLPSPTPSESFEIPAGQETVTPEIGPDDVKGISVLATVTNAQPEHRNDTYLTATVTAHSDISPVEYYCRSHDVPTWIAYADGDLVGDGSSPAHDWWSFRSCRPDEPTTFTLHADLFENIYHRVEPKTAQMCDGSAEC